MLAIWTRSKRLACSNRVPERPELAGARLPGGARKGVHGISQFDVDEAGTSDHGLPACARQGPSDSTGPEIDISKASSGTGRSRQMSATVIRPPGRSTRWIWR